MSAQPGSPEFDELFTVFDGSSPEDVSHARQLWSSLSLLPPQESRLVSADIRQRLPVSRPQRGSTGPKSSAAPQPSSTSDLRQRQEERQRYLSMADQRREILALLRRQRDQRIQKELLSEPFKPKMKISRGKVSKPQNKTEFEVEQEQELVKQLQ